MSFVLVAAFMPLRRSARTLPAALACLMFMFAQCANAQRSYFRLYDQNQGLAAGEIAALAQDEKGFVWIGANRGLLRFDGREFMRWAPLQLDEVVYELAYGPNDELIARTASGLGLRRTPHGLEAVAGPAGTPLKKLASIDFDKAGRLWAVIDQQLWRRDTQRHWQQLDQLLDGASPRRLRALGNDLAVFT